MMETKWYKFWNPGSGTVGGLIFGGIICVIIFAVVPNLFEKEPSNSSPLGIEQKVEKLEEYVLVLQQAVLNIQGKQIPGHTDELKELRHITDEFRAQIKGLQKEVLIGIQEGGM